VCIDRVDGSFPIRAVTLEIGGRRPLGFGSAGLAILAGLTDGEVEQILSGLHRDIAANPRVTRESLLKAVSQTRAQGYGMIHHTTVMGVGAIGIVVPERPGLPLLGVGVAMVSERLSQARARTIHRIMTEELATV
jgi:DNA-binding IclR family transcriptional regulator